MKPGNLCDSHKQSDLLPLDIILIMMFGPGEKGHAGAGQKGPFPPGANNECSQRKKRIFIRLLRYGRCALERGPPASMAWLIEPTNAHSSQRCG